MEKSKVGSATSRALGLSVAILALSISAQATMYGPDRRMEVGLSKVRLQMAQATAMMVSPVYYTKNPSAGFDFHFPPLSSDESASVCPTERFADQPTNPVSCTGFLVGPDLLLTAGHCAVISGEVRDTATGYCENFSWLFGFANDASGKVNLSGVPAENLYKCKKVIYAGQTSEPDAQSKVFTFRRDIALIQLDRVVVNRTPMKLANHEAQKGEVIGTIGYPLGLPAKSLDGVRVTDDSNAEYFRAQLSLLGGNSGGPVYNLANEVVGIAVRAFPDADFVFDAGLACNRLNSCDADGSNCKVNTDPYPSDAHIQRLSPILDELKRAGIPF